MFSSSYILMFLILLPFLGAFVISLINEAKKVLIKTIALNFSLFTFLLSLLLWFRFDNSTAKFQFVKTISWLSFININVTLGIDGISLFFILLTTFLISLCLLSSWFNIDYSIKLYVIFFLILDSLLILVFSVLDLLLFYLFFESVLIPMFLIIGIWGSRERKIRAAYQFFLYTLFGSLLLLLGIIFIYFYTGTTDFVLLLQVVFPKEYQIILWLAFFVSFAVKVPMVPFHIWLPEAHTEAPTAGSVLLAGVLLKLGTYGFLRFSLTLFPYASIYFSPFIFVLSLIAIIYTSLTTLRQVDLKKIIAYSSVAHMGFVTIGLFSNTFAGVTGSLLLMLSHGIVSSCLFLCIGVLYDRYKTRLIKYYSGLVQTMPLFAVVFFFFTLANLSLPGTSSFISEFLILLGTSQTNFLVSVFATSGVVFGAAYSIWLYNRVMFGSLNVNNIFFFSDLTRLEFFLFFPCILIVLIVGFYSTTILNVVYFSILNVLL